MVAVGGGLILANDPNEGLGPINIYIFIGTMLGLLFAGMYIAVNVAIIGFFLESGVDEFHFIKHRLIPIFGVLFMIPAFMSVIGGSTIPIFDVPLPAFEGALSWTAPIAAVWMLIGVVLYFVLRSRNPEALDRMGEIYGGEAPAAGDLA